MLSRSLLVVFVLIALVKVSNAQTVFNSVEDVWKYADEHNVTIRNAGYELDKSVAARKQSILAFLPQVNANASFTDNMALQTTLIPAIIFDKTAAPGAVRAVQFGQKYIYVAGVTAQMDILNLQTWYNTKVAKNGEELGKAAMVNAKKSIYQQLAGQFYSYLLMEQAAMLARRSLAISDSVFQSVTSKFEQGTVNQSNVDLAKINKEKLEMALTTALYQLQIARNSIKSMLNFSVSDSIIIAATLQNNWTADAYKEFNEDPAIKQAWYQTKVSLGQYQAARSNIIPTLTVAYSTTKQQNDNTFEPFSNGPAWFPAQFWSLRATWNIFTAGNRLLQTERGKISWNQSKLQYESMQKQSAFNDENLRLNYRKAVVLLGKSESVMKLSQDNYDHIVQRYNEGLSPYTDMLNAYSDFINYQNQYLNNLADMLAQICQVKIRQHTF